MSQTGYSATLAGDAIGSITGIESISLGSMQLTVDKIWDLCAYRTGTATFTNGQTAVTGSGTTWTAAMVGRMIHRDADGTDYKIASRSSNTAIALATAYAGSTGSGAYTIQADRIGEHVPLGVEDAPLTLVVAWNKTVHDTLWDALLARTQDEWTLTDDEGSTHVGNAVVHSVGDKNLDTSGHATFTVTLVPVTAWAFTAAA